MFECTKVRTEKLNRILNALKTIQASSTSAERTFSVAGNFKTKVQNSLHTDKLNTLVYLKYHFMDS